MKQQRNARVSIIIPCFNEQDAIGACLDAIAAQSMRPYEVIVVDNNCSDDTAAIAKRYDFVTLITERQPGLVAARDRGFAYATGEILARIDADSVVKYNWVAELQEAFFQYPQVQAVAGSGYFYDAPLRWLHRPVRDVTAVWLNRLLCSHFTLWGSNMAVRSTAWQRIKGSVCRESNLMEDIDISIHLFDRYGRSAVRFVPSLLADTSMRRATSTPVQLWRYFRMWPRTLRKHGYWGALLTWPAIAFLMLNTIWASILIRLYDQQQKRLVLNLHQWRQKAGFDRDNP